MDGLEVSKDYYAEEERARLGNRVYFCNSVLKAGQLSSGHATLRVLRSQSALDFWDGFRQTAD